jgi:hypothetical protein
MPESQHYERTVTYLRTLQAEHYNGRSSSYIDDWLPADHPEQTKVRRQWDEQWKQMMNSRPTELQDPSSYMILSFATEAIKKAAQRLEYVVEDRAVPVFGSVASGVLNACITRVPDGQPLLIFEDGLLGFKHLAISNLVAGLPTMQYQDQTLCDIDYGRAKNYLQSNGQSIQDTLELYDAYLVRGSPWFVRSGNLVLRDFARWAQAAPVSYAMTLFIVGHEWGHLLLGHLAEGYASKPPVAVAGGPDWPPEHWDEFAADRLGCRLAADAMIAEGFVVPDTELVSLCSAMVGAQLFFVYMDTIERSLSILKTGRDTVLHSPTHPASYLRLDCIRDWLARSTFERTGKYIQEYVDHWLQTADLHLAAVRKHMLEGYARGTRPALMFR